MHPFTRAGFGPAPFRCIGVRENRFEIPGFGWKPGGNCRYCGTGILYEYVIKSAEGREFIVGSDCVRKTGAEVTGFREQRLNLARTKRETRRAEDRTAREARWAANRALRAATFQADPLNAALIKWLQDTPADCKNDFQRQMKEHLQIIGSFSDKQRDAIQKMMQREEERDRIKQNSEWLGEIGKPIEVEAAIAFQTCWASDFGWPRVFTYLTVLHQGDNVLVYKGNRLGERGEKVKGKFTVKEHGERDGTKQTIINRPRNLQVLP